MSLKLKAYDENELRKLKHFEENRYVCSICIEIFLTIDNLKNHYISTHGYKQKEQEKLQSDSESSEPVAKQSYFSPKTCSICEMTFKNQKTLFKHVKYVHNKFKSNLCQVCNKSFSRKASLDIHSRTHLSADDVAKIVLSCSACTFKCSDPSVMSKHRKLHKSTAEGKYKCLDTECKYLAIQATGLKNHIRSKHPQLYLTMKCTLCEFVSVNPERLNQHKLNHEKGLLEKKEEAHKVEQISKNSLNTSMEISSDCFLPIESTDSIHNLDHGGHTIIHNNSSSSNVHNEDAVF